MEAIYLTLTMHEEGKKTKRKAKKAMMRQRQIGVVCLIMAVVTATIGVKIPGMGDMLTSTAIFAVLGTSCLFCKDLIMGV